MIELIKLLILKIRKFHVKNKKARKNNVNEDKKHVNFTLIKPLRGCESLSPEVLECDKLLRNFTFGETEPILDVFEDENVKFDLSDIDKDERFNLFLEYLILKKDATGCVKITLKDMAETFNVTRRTVELMKEKAIETGLIKQVGHKIKLNITQINEWRSKR